MTCDVIFDYFAITRSSYNTAEAQVHVITWNKEIHIAEVTMEPLNHHVKRQRDRDRFRMVQRTQAYDY